MNKANTELIKRVKEFIGHNKLTNKEFGREYLNMGESQISNILAGREPLNYERLEEALNKHGYESEVNIIIWKIPKKRLK